MFDFLLADLLYAEQYISNASYGTRLLPDLGCVYGLLARLYTWVRGYPKAADYAQGHQGKWLHASHTGCVDQSEIWFQLYGQFVMDVGSEVREGKRCCWHRYL